MDKRSSYKKSVLDNGLSIVSERDPSFYSASVGIWVKTGSRDESPETNGISHFIEHMLFKGTGKRSAEDIAKEMDALGGAINAFTESEATCYYVKVLGSHVEKAMDILGDIFLNSTFDKDEIQKERDVILQEISMVEDTPDDYIHELFSETFWGASPLGYPVLGSSKNVRSFTRDVMTDYMRRMYSADRIIVAAAGDIDHEELVQYLEGGFSGISKESPPRKEHAGGFSSNSTILKKRLEQVHICLGTKGISGVSSRRHAAYILNTVLGSGMSSRLFQEIREKRGLAYNIYSYLSTYVDTGLFGIYAGTSKKAYPEVLELIGRELKRFRDISLSDDDLGAAKEQLKGNIVLGLESSDNRMQRLAHNEIYFGREVPLDDSLKAIDAVSSSDVIELARDMFSQESLNLAILGNVKKGTAERKMDEMRKLLI